jgi:hypothetical protein
MALALAHQDRVIVPVYVSIPTQMSIIAAVAATNARQVRHVARVFVATCKATRTTAELAISNA